MNLATFRMIQLRNEYLPAYITSVDIVPIHNVVMRMSVSTLQLPYVGILLAWAIVVEGPAVLSVTSVNVLTMLTLVHAANKNAICHT